MPGSVRVAVVGCDPLFHAGLRALLDRVPGISWAGSVVDARALPRLRARSRPDVVLVDSAVEPISGHASSAAEFGRSTPVVVLLRSCHGSVRFVANLRAAGIRGIIRQSATSRDIVAAVRAVSAREHFIDPALVAKAAPRARTAPDDEPPPYGLTPRELQVLRLVAEGLDNRAIAELLHVGVETVRSHVKSCLRKLSARNRTHAVGLSYRGGILPVRDRTAARTPGQDQVRLPGARSAPPPPRGWPV